MVRHRRHKTAAGHTASADEQAISLPDDSSAETDTKTKAGKTGLEAAWLRSSLVQKQLGLEAFLETCLENL